MPEVLFSITITIIVQRGTTCFISTKKTLKNSEICVKFKDPGTGSTFRMRIRLLIRNTACEASQTARVLPAESLWR
jgi:hypothetical protein